MHACSINMWEAEAGGLLEFQGQPGLTLSQKRRGGTTYLISITLEKYLKGHQELYNYLIVSCMICY